MHFWSLLTDIGILLTASLILGAITIRLGLSPLVGYLIAGLFLGGAGSFNMVKSPIEIEAIAELGVSLLLFSLGLEFSWNKIKTFSMRIFNAGLLQILLTPLVIIAFGFFIGFDFKLVVFFALVLTLSSTATVLRTLIDLGEADSAHGRNATAVLLLQDVAVIPFTIIVSLLISVHGGSQSLMFIFASVLVLIVGLYFLLNKIAVPILSSFTLENNREMSILLAIIIGIGSAWAAHQIGISPAIGAFIAGMMLGSSPYALQITADVSPLRILFLTLFFGSVGMVADPIWIGNNIVLVLSLTFTIIILKTLISYMIFKLCKNTIAVSLASALTISQIGEFAFVLSTIAKEGHLISAELHQIIFSVTIMSILFTTLLIKEASRIGLWFQQIFIKREDSNTNKATKKEETEASKIFVIGYGPAGHEVIRMLKEKGHDKIVIIDLNKDSINSARAQGFKAYVGDSRQVEILQHHKLNKAKLVIITIPSHEASLRTIDVVKKLAPNAIILVRARNQIHKESFEKAGAHRVINEELKVGQSIGELALKYLNTGLEKTDV